MASRTIRSKLWSVALGVVLLLVVYLPAGAQAQVPNGQVVCTAVTSIKLLVINDGNNNGEYDEGVDEFEPNGGFFLIDQDDLSAPPMRLFSGERALIYPARWLVIAVHGELYGLVGVRNEASSTPDDGYPSAPDPHSVFEALVMQDAGVLNISCGVQYVILTLWQPFQHHVVLPTVINN